MKGILGKKLGMTQVFTEEGMSVPVTVVEAGPCVVVQKKTSDNDGYTAVQLGFEPRSENKVNKPLKGHFNKAGVKPFHYLRELRVDNPEDYEVGQEIKADVFSAGDKVDVRGISKGKGFAGGIKRHGFSRGPMAHGSKYHRRSGSLGSVEPARVFKGRKMPGHMGNERITVRNLEIVKADPERNLLLIKGAIPGPRKGLVVITASRKS